jgi:hypothetical protein
MSVSQKGVIYNPGGEGGEGTDEFGPGVCEGNTATGECAVVSGGSENTVSGSWSTVGGGFDNTASGDSTTVAGGSENTASGPLSTVGGGQTNTASGFGSTVGGGGSNTASDSGSTVGGGFSNLANNTAATVGGGSSNAAVGNTSTVSGGTNNSATSLSSTVGGGYNNTAIGNYATVSGGAFNSAGGVGSWVPGGFNAQTGNTAHAHAWSGAFRTVSGDNQHFGLPVQKQTNDTTPTVLTSDRLLPDEIVVNTNGLLDNSTWSGLVWVVARSSTGETAGWLFWCVFKRGAGPSTTSLVHSTTIASNIEAGLSGVTCTLQANTTEGRADISVVGIAATEIDWFGEFFGGRIHR